MKTVAGFYNELEYIVFLNDREIYRAGNNPFDSQGFVKKEDGVGLEKMKDYCEQTAKEIALEEYADFIGIEYQNIDLFT